MFNSALYLSSFLHLLLSVSPTITTAAAANTPPYPSQIILLNCGAESNTTYENRTWEADSLSKFTPPDILNISDNATASDQMSGVPQVPYMTARIFRSNFTYTFPVSAGPKFLRLYFYPSAYDGFDKTNSFFSVTAANYTLLSNFSAFLTVQAIKPQIFSLVKEFIINVNENQNQILHLTFSPSPNSYAFINGIEVASIPENFYIKGNEHPIKLVGQTSDFTIDNSRALETLYRLNVGGNDVAPADDSGLLRSWVQYTDYLFGGYLGFVPHVSIRINYTAETPVYSAPVVVYTTSRTTDNLTVTNPSQNLTWRFEVDGGFNYLVRLYFCEIQQEVDLENKRVFDIFINSKLAERLVDIFKLTHHRGTPLYIDYVVYVKYPDGHMRKEDLWLQMHPDMKYKPMYASTLLNGVEIFKLSQPNGNLAAPNPELIVDPQPPTPNGKSNDNRNSKGSSLLIRAVAGVFGGIIVVSLAGFLICRRRIKREKGSDKDDAKSWWDIISYASKSTKTNASSLPSVRCRHFSIEEIKSATANFDDNFVIGKGGFGNVYKGYMENSAITVAIKRLNPSSRQGVHEFQTEIRMLSNLRHLHLVSLIGYCDEYGEMILVYDYMAQGTLRSHLYSGDNPPLSWKQRLEICIGAARGLHYLHAGAKRQIIHRDVKSTNILLDEKWVAKVSDFGLSKMGPSDTSASHVSTVVKGSMGYLDPEYYRRQQLTDKSDVYSFGVVLFEVLCARPVIIPELPRQQLNLAEWARMNYRKGTLDQIIDQNLKDEIAPESLKKFGEVGYSCLKDEGIDRPTMSDVVWSLEFVLQLQEEAADKLGEEIDEAVHLLKEEEMTTTNSDVVLSKSSGTSITKSDGEFKSESASVFSEIMDPDGR